MIEKTKESTDELLKDLKNKSEKIRALAKAGYPRTEISKMLGVRYQHVRNVMLKSGMTGGFTNSKRVKTRKNVSKAVSKASARPVKGTSWEFLLKAGFRYVGDWELNEKRVLHIDGKLPKEPGIYAFALGTEIVYIGRAPVSLHQRVEQYRRRNKNNKETQRVGALIASKAAGEHRLKLLTATPEPLRWNGLAVDTAAGLEASLLHLLNPSWNRQKG